MQHSPQHRVNRLLLPTVHQSRLLLLLLHRRRIQSLLLAPKLCGRGHRRRGTASRKAAVPGALLHWSKSLVPDGRVRRRSSQSGEPAAKCLNCSHEAPFAVAGNYENVCVVTVQNVIKSPSPPQLAFDTSHIHMSVSLTHSEEGSSFPLIGNARPSRPYIAHIHL